MYGCESWTVKKAECRRIDAFELWCWRRLLRVPWTARKSIQSNLKEFCPGCSLEGLMLKLKLQYFGHLMWRVGRVWGQEEKGTTENEMAGWHHRLNGHEFKWTLWVGDGHGSLACCDSWGRKVRHNWATELNFYLSALTFNILKFLKHEISNLTDRFTVAVNIQQYSGNVCSFNRLLYLKLKFLIVPEKFNNR